CGMVPPVSGTSIIRRRAASTALRTASLTSLAFPVATPTRPCPSPTATSALNPKRRPPLTTLATRLIEITFSMRPSPSRCRSPPELQSAFAGAAGHCLAAPVIPIPAAVEHDLVDPLLFGLAGHELAHGEALRRLALPLDRHPFRAVRRAHQRDAPRVVHQLGVDVLRGPQYDQPRPLGRARYFVPHPQVPLVPALRASPYLVDRSHGPTWAPGQSCRPYAGPAHPRSGSPSPCTARVVGWRAAPQPPVPRAPCRRLRSSRARCCRPRS